MFSNVQGAESQLAVTFSPGIISTHRPGVLSFGINQYLETQNTDMSTFRTINILLYMQPNRKNMKLEMKIRLDRINIKLYKNQMAR